MRNCKNEEEGKLGLLWQWKEKKGKRGTPTLIKKIAESYCSHELSESDDETESLQEEVSRRTVQNGPSTRNTLREKKTFDWRKGGVLLVAVIAILSAWMLSCNRALPETISLSISDTLASLCSGEPRCFDYNKNVDIFISEVNKQTHKEANAHSLAEVKRPRTRVHPETVMVNFYNTPISAQEYVPQTGFIQQGSRQAGAEIQPSDFFAPYDKREFEHVAIVGGVGYGKTEMLKWFANAVLGKAIPNLIDIDLVYFVNFRDLKVAEQITPGELLFGAFNLTPDQINCGIEYMSKNPGKVLLVMDGIDQYHGELGRCVPALNYRNVHNTSSILYNLLSGKLFPGLRILTSSREHAIRHFEGTARPDKVVALAGLSLGSMETLVHGFSGENEDFIWDHLTHRSPNLLSVSSIPMFLVYSVLVLQRHKSNPPKTVTEVLMLVFNDHISSEHVHEEALLEVLPIVKKMAYSGTSDGRLTFTVSELPPNVTLDTVQDLMSPLPGTKASNQKLREGHFKLFFSHQSVQESLTALYVAEMGLREFEEFVSEKLHDPKWVVVRRILCGLLLNDNTRKIARGNDPTVSLLKIESSQEIQKKQEILKSSLQSQLDNLQGDGKLRLDLLELMHTLHESGSSVDEVISSSMHEINLLNVPLTPSDVHVVMSILSRCPKLMLLSLINCKLGQEPLKLLLKTLRRSECRSKVRVLLLGNYENNLPHESALVIRQMIPFVSDLLWLGYRVEDGDIEIMQETLDLVRHDSKYPTVVCWRRHTRRMVMLEHQADFTAGT